MLVLFVCVTFGLSYIWSYARSLNRNLTATRRIRLATFIGGFLIGLALSIALLTASFFIYAAIVGPPLQTHSWLSGEQFIFYALALTELIGLGIGVGTVTARTLNRMA